MASKTLIENVSHKHVLFRTTLNGTKRFHPVNVTSYLTLKIKRNLKSGLNTVKIDLDEI